MTPEVNEIYPSLSTLKSDSIPSDLDSIEGLLSDYSFYKRQDPEGYSYYAAMDPLGYEPSTPIEEATKVATRICDLAKSKVQLCLSSGVDSQAMLQAFINCNQDFEVFVLKFQYNLNAHDTDFIIEHCKALGIKPKIIDLDVIHFFESGDFYSYGERYQCQSPQLATHLWLLDQLDGTPVLSGNFIVPIMQNEELFWVGLPGDLHGCLFRYFKQNNRVGEPWFFINSSELASSFLYLETFSKFSGLAVKDGNEFNYEARCRGYKDGGFTISPQDSKQTGFEAVRKHYDEKYNTKHGTAFDALFRVPLVDLNPITNSYFQFVPIQLLPQFEGYSRMKWLINKIKKFSY